MVKGRAKFTSEAIGNTLLRWRNLGGKRVAA